MNASRVLSIALLTLWFSIPTSRLGANEQQPFHIHVDISDNKLHVLSGEELLMTYDVSVGKDRHPTPKGDFAIRKIVWNPSWVPPPEKWAKGKTAKEPGDPDNPMKAVKMFFVEPDYYIHGTGDTESLGRAASHGCIRMDPQEARELAQQVMEHGGKPRPDPWYRRIFRSRKTTVVNLTDPVPLAVVD